MGDAYGLEYTRQDFKKDPVKDRVQHWKEFVKILPEKDLMVQGARCMDCGVPFCQSGCPSAILFLIGTILFTATAGRKRLDVFTRPIIFPNLPDASARLLARIPAFWVLTNRLLPSKISRCRLLNTVMSGLDQAAACRAPHREKSGGDRFRSVGSCLRRPVEQAGP